MWAIRHWFEKTRAPKRDFTTFLRLGHTADSSSVLRILRRDLGTAVRKPQSSHRRCRDHVYPGGHSHRSKLRRDSGQHISASAPRSVRSETTLNFEEPLPIILVRLIPEVIFAAGLEQQWTTVAWTAIFLRTAGFERRSEVHCVRGYFQFRFIGLQGRR